MIDIFNKENGVTLRELELFYALCEIPHISQLAREIGMSQSAISLAIKSLEKKLGEPLFDRIGKQIVLNARGRFFYRQTYPHFLALKEAQRHFQEQQFSGTLQIASSKTIGDYITPQIVYDFRSLHPGVEIERRTRNSEQIIHDILEGSIDLGFIETECSEPKIIKEHLRMDSLVVVTSDPKIAASPCYVDQLFHKKWLIREKGSGTRALFLQRLGALAKELEIFMEYSEFGEIKSLLLHNPETITSISRIAVADELARGQLHEVPLINLSFERAFYLVYHRETYRSRLFEAFTEFAKRSVKGEEG